MAYLQLTLDEAEGGLPELCMCCGRPAATTVTRRMSWHPGWVFWTLLLHPLICLIVVLVTMRRATLRAPLCRRHQGHWFRRSLITWMSFFAFSAFGALLIVVYAAEPNHHAREEIGAYACGVSGFLLLMWAVIAISCRLTSIRATEIDEDEIVLAGVSEEFADAVETAEQEREERRAARRREREKKPAVPSKPVPVIFISYRRSDSQDVTGRIYDRLVAKYSKKHVFKDVDNMPIGISFATHIKQKISKADLVLVIIGPDWVSAANSQGRRRLDDPNDFVRMEVETALRANIPVVPVLVSNACIPRAEELPRSIQKLLSRHGSAVRPDPDFNADIQRLIAGIEKLGTLRIKPRPENPETTGEHGPVGQSISAAGGGSRNRHTPRIILMALVILLLLAPIAFFVSVGMGLIDARHVPGGWFDRPQKKSR